MANYTAELRDRVLNDPQFQQLWRQRGEALATLQSAGNTPTPEARQAYIAAAQPLLERFRALGGDENNFPRIGADGAPEGTPVKSKAAFIGQTALYAGGALLGAGLAGGAIPGLVSGATTGGGTAASVAPTVAGGTGAATGSGFLGSLGGVKGILGAVGPISGAISGARGQARIAEGNYGLNRDRAEAERALTNSTLDNQRMSQALRLALLGGVQDAQITPPSNIAARMPTLTGGVKPSAFKGREDIVNAMQPRILQSLMTGEHLPPMSAEPSSNWLDKILEGTSYASAFAGALPKPSTAPKPPTVAPMAPVDWSKILPQTPTLPDYTPPSRTYNPNLIPSTGVTFGRR